MMLFCSPPVLEEDTPLWLLSRWDPPCQPADVTLFEGSVSRGVTAAYKRACPRADRELRAAPACLICQPSSPASSRRPASDGGRAPQLCAKHLLLVTSRLSARGRAQPPPQSPTIPHASLLSVFADALALTNRPARPAGGQEAFARHNAHLCTRVSRGTECAL